ncbi:MAG: EAL domain-containing protein [Thiobacillus sp.]|nr:EAL domain-containing protein [Thiobacillus sp.]
MASSLSQQQALHYIRAKVDQLLTVMGTMPLRPEELDDSTLIDLDPIGIIAESFRQVIDHLNETNQRLSVATSEIRTILDTLGAAIVVMDMDDRIEDCNPQALEWFFGGVDKARIIGRPANEACNCAEGMVDLRARADGTSHVACVYGRDMQVVASKILDEAGNHAKTVMLFTDISQQKATERHLRLYSEVFRHVGEGIMITDADKRIIEVNEAVTRITGYDRDELIASRPEILRSGLHDEAFYELLWRTVRGQGFWQGEILDRTKDGRLIPLLENISEVRDGEGRLTHHIAVMTDISFLKETQTRLDFLAHHDALTELPNRLLFNDRLAHAIDFAHRDGRALALLFIDLDRFKNINDSLGHHIGDLLLVEAARRLRALVRTADTLARLGGDEFVVLMETGASHGAATNLAGKIVSAFKQPFQVGGVDLHIGCSIGVTLFPEDGDDAATLLKNADVAMYRAKEAGREGHVRYSAELSEAMRRKLELDNALRTAVREGAFELHYQPIIDLAQGRPRACEALIRWPDGPVSARSPDRFIPVAEEMRLILPLGEWILRQALGHKRAWREGGLELDYVSVNISAVQLAQPDFTERVVALLAECGVAGHELQIELTENVLMADIELCAWVLARLREHGIRVAIDDFGTGYSSLAYLKQLPIDNLKIDRSFVRDIPDDPNDCAIASAVIGLARTLGLEAIAEGIETQAQQDYLASVGCGIVQGFLHGRPMPEGEFAAYVRESARIR